MASKTKIIIVDDHSLVSKAIADLIQEADKKYQVTHLAQNGKVLFSILVDAKNLPDLILLDVNMPVMNGFETLEKLKKDFPQIPVVALSMNDDDTTIINMMKGGACGYISKMAKEEELINALESVINKGFYYTDEVSKLLVNNLQQKKSPINFQFTDREKELLTLICSELTYKEIADIMHVSPKTVDGYREDLFTKLNVKSRVGLAMFAMKNGFCN